MLLKVLQDHLQKYNNFDIQNYWFNPESTVVYTNMDVFDNLIQTDSLGKVLQEEEPFCLATFPYHAV